MPPTTAKRDYYDVLGVGRGADVEEIRKAYRQKALEFHPDRNKSDGAAEKFKEVNEAYQVLSDADTRARYDRLGHSGVNGSSARGFDGFADFGGFGDIFESFFGATRQRGPMRGRDLEIDLEVSFREAAFGATRKLRISRSVECDRCGGDRAEPGTEVRSCGTCAGTGQVRRTATSIFGGFQEVSECPTCRGTGRIVSTPCRECDGRGLADRETTLEIKVPAGIVDNTQIVMRGHGDAGEIGGGSGDLYVRLHVLPDPIFSRRDDDVHLTIQVNAVKAMLGYTVKVPTLDGEHDLEIPPGVQTGDTMVIANAGVMPLHGRRNGHGRGERGDQIVTVFVKTPEKVTSSQRELLQELAEDMEDEDEDVFEPKFGTAGGGNGNSRRDSIWDRLRGAFNGE